jgi:uncharacterized membrane protein YozB (DUF420 family)
MYLSACLLLAEHRHKVPNNASSFIPYEKRKMSMNMNFNYLNSYLQQESLTMMLVALGLAIIGIGYARLRSKESLQLHRWIMSGAVFLNLISIFAVMFPSLFIYYINPSDAITSPFSVLQIIHMAIGFPAVVLSVMYVFNDLPQPPQRWMQITAVLWIMSIALGAIVYYTMPS